MRERQYGLVISDWNMEPMTGYDLLQEVRSDPGLAATPFIMVTAESKTENVIAAKKAGVSNYIVKPFNAQTLKTKIDAVFPDEQAPASLNFCSIRVQPGSSAPSAEVVARTASEAQPYDFEYRCAYYPSSASRLRRSGRTRPWTREAHHTNCRITALGISPAAVKASVSAAGSGFSRPPSSSA